MGAAAGNRALVADDATGEAGEDRRESGAARSVRHFPIGRGCRAEGAVPKNPSPHRWAAAGPFAAMTTAHPVASGSPGRAGVCRAGRSAPSRGEMATGPGFSSPNQTDQERITAYCISSGPASRSDAHYAIIVGDREVPSGQSRLKGGMTEATIVHISKLQPYSKTRSNTQPGRHTPHQETNTNISFQVIL